MAEKFVQDNKTSWGDYHMAWLGSKEEAEKLAKKLGGRVEDDPSGSYLVVKGKENSLPDMSNWTGTRINRGQEKYGSKKENADRVYSIGTKVTIKKEATGAGGYGGQKATVTKLSPSKDRFGQSVYTVETEDGVDHTYSSDQLE